MASARIVQIILVLTLCLGLQAKVYTRCQLTRELLKNNFSRTFLSNWVCLIEQESDRNTSAMVVKSPRRKYYGLFQIGSEWCKEGKKGGKCDITCESLLDEDIKDDGVCAVKVFEAEGFKYWAKWEARCKGAKNLPDVEKFSLCKLCTVDSKKARLYYMGNLVKRGCKYPSAEPLGKYRRDFKCPDWVHPPANRASPPRDKRTIRGKRQIKRFSRRAIFLSQPF